MVACNFFSIVALKTAHFKDSAFVDEFQPKQRLRCEIVPYKAGSEICVKSVLEFYLGPHIKKKNCEQGLRR